MKKFMVNRDEKIINEIIKPKDEIIEKENKSINIQKPILAGKYDVSWYIFIK